METAERQDTIFEVVRELGAELNGGKSPQISLTTHLEWDLGLASIERHELLTRLEAALGTELSSRAVFEAVTVSDLLKLLPGSETRWRQVEQVQPGQAPPYPDEAATLVEALEYQARHQPSRTTLYFLNEDQVEAQWSYADLLKAAQSAAGGLAALGVKRGDRVGMMLPTGPEYVATFFGILWLGAVPVPLYPPFRLDQLEDYVKRQSTILDLSRVGLLVSFERAKAVLPLLKLHCSGLRQIVTVSEIQGTPIPADPYPTALIQFTSGSTGIPKGVVLSHAALLANIRAYGQALDLTPDDVTISWLPLYHDMGLIGAMLGSIYHGQPLVLMGPQDFLSRPSRWLWAVHRYRGTISPAPNFAFEICARKIPDKELEELDLSSWRIALNGAETVRPDTLRRFTERFAPLGFQDSAHFPAYGLAEASLAVTFPPPGRGPLIDTINRKALEQEGIVASCGAGDPVLSLVACGRPLPGMEVRIVDAQGKTLEERVRGQVEFRGPSSLDGYYNNPAATNRIKDPEGWVKTGDLGYLSEGELYLTGRSKDIIVKAGRNLQPEDIEDAVASVEGVRRGCVAAFGIPDEKEGTEALVVVAETRLKDHEAKEQLRRAISVEVAQFLGLPPDRVVVVASGCVPKTPSGKIRRSECRDRLLAETLESSRGLLAQVRRLMIERARALSHAAVELPSRLAREVWRHSWLFGCLAVPQVLAVLNPKAGQRALGPAARLYLRMTGVELEVTDSLEDSGPCLIVCNHASGLDPVILTAALPRSVKFMVAPWVADHPMFKNIVVRMGHLSVQRGQAGVAEEQNQEIQRFLGQGVSAAFPEGGIEVTPGLRPFALGVFKAAAAAGIPVVPVALSGTREVQPWPRKVASPGKVKVTIGSPLQPQGQEWEHIVDLAARSRAFIADHCGYPLSNRRLRRVD